MNSVKNLIKYLLPPRIFAWSVVSDPQDGDLRVGGRWVGGLRVGGPQVDGRWVGGQWVSGWWVGGSVVSGLVVFKVCGQWSVVGGR